MKAAQPDAGPRRLQRPPAAPHGSVIIELDRARILRALARRRRYKYVKPRVEREGPGWKIVSPNCSRSVDPAGGEIDVAWFVPIRADGWMLYARDHQLDCWTFKAGGLTLAEALSRVCSDANREFWV